MKMKIKLESWNLAQVSTLGYTYKFQSNFFISAVKAVNSWWQLIPDENENQLLTTDENKNQARELEFSTSTNFSVNIKIPAIFFI